MTELDGNRRIDRCSGTRPAIGQTTLRRDLARQPVARRRRQRRAVSERGRHLPKPHELGGIPSPGRGARGGCEAPLERQVQRIGQRRRDVCQIGELGDRHRPGPPRIQQGAGQHRSGPGAANLPAGKRSDGNSEVCVGSGERLDGCGKSAAGGMAGEAIDLAHRPATRGTPPARQVEQRREPGDVVLDQAARRSAQDHHSDRVLPGEARPRRAEHRRLGQGPVPGRDGRGSCQRRSSCGHRIAAVGSECRGGEEPPVWAGPRCRLRHRPSPAGRRDESVREGREHRVASGAVERTGGRRPSCGGEPHEQPSDHQACAHRRTNDDGPPRSVHHHQNEYESSARVSVFL